MQTPGLYSPWNSLGRNTGMGSLSLLQGIFPTQGSNPGLLHCRQILYQLNYKGNLRILEWVAYPFSSGPSRLRNRTGVSCIAGRFFTSWAMREAQFSTIEDAFWAKFQLKPTPQRKCKSADSTYAKNNLICPHSMFQRVFTCPLPSDWSFINTLQGSYVNGTPHWRLVNRLGVFSNPPMSSGPSWNGLKTMPSIPSVQRRWWSHPVLWSELTAMSWWLPNI